jgi:hypothetical protein
MLCSDVNRLCGSAKWLMENKEAIKVDAVMGEHGFNRVLERRENEDSLRHIALIHIGWITLL